MPTIRSDSIVEDSDGDSSHQRCLSERCHDNLKNVMITGFCSEKSMIALTVHIIEKTKSLECLTLDTTRGHDRRYVNVDKCLWLSKDALMEAEKARVAIRRYVEGRVPHAVNLKVIEPCSKCIY
uniref:At1g61320/AtMIF1 LRR domain-containing protein n=1 Tax=Arundo donax TaxID=35708 RepID=A0A0A9ESL4_ARUDO